MIDEKVGDHFGRAKYATPRVGIELEFEGWHDDVYPETEWWTLTQDASLRNGGVEFVSHPLRYKDVDSALDEAEQLIHEYDLEANERCGLHTHLNVAILTWRQLFALGAEHALIQPWLYREFAPGRETNHFCVPAWANSALTRVINRVATEMKRGALYDMYGEPRNPDFIRACPKYSSLNYAPINRLQTVEFREAAGSHNMLEVQRWVQLIIKLQQEAVHLGGPDEVITELEDIGIHGKLEKYGIGDHEVNELDIEDAVDTAHLYCGTTPLDWRTLDWEL